MPEHEISNIAVKGTWYQNDSATITGQFVNDLHATLQASFLLADCQEIYVTSAQKMSLSKILNFILQKNPCLIIIHRILTQPQ